MMPRVAAAVTRRHTAPLFVLLGVLAAILGLGLLGEAEHRTAPTDGIASGVDSTRAVELRGELPEEPGSSAVIVWTTTDDGEPIEALLDELDALASELGAVGTDSGPVTASEDGTAAIAVVPVTATDAEEVADVVSDLRDELAAATPDGLTAQVTGPAAVEADLAAVFEGADARLLIATATVVALILILVYRSPFLWLVPLTVVSVADRLAAVLATRALDAVGLPWDASTLGILSVLVFGAGTDYALLLISRYRDELRTHDSRHEAMATALARTAEAVVASATTVVLGLLTLLLSLVPTTRALGLACAVGVLVGAVFVLLVLPAALSLCPRSVFWPRVPHEGEAQLADTRSLWQRVGAQVDRRPRTFTAVSVGVLAVMSIGVFRLDLGLDQSEQFLERPEAIAAAERLGESFPAGLTDPTQVLTRDDPDQVLEAVQGSGAVESARVTAQADGIAQIDAVLRAEPGSDAARAAVLDLRADLASYDDTFVGGTEAAAVDEATAAARDRKVIFPLVLGLVLVALVGLLRSLVAPVLLVATVLATYAASLGASWWIFTRVLGFEALDAGVPLLAFLFLVALGVDYNIFLVTRAREESAKHGSRLGMLRALTATGGVITSAGILLAAVFLVLGVLPLVVLAQLGAIICLGVLLDTLLVRTVLVPALALILEDRFWWPRVPAGAGTAATTSSS